jgi:hypothetical protein
MNQANCKGHYLIMWTVSSGIICNTNILCRIHILYYKAEYMYVSMLLETYQSFPIPLLYNMQYTINKTPPVKVTTIGNKNPHNIHMRPHFEYQLRYIDGWGKTK